MRTLPTGRVPAEAHLQCLQGSSKKKWLGQCWKSDAEVVAGKLDVDSALWADEKLFRSGARKRRKPQSGHLSEERAEGAPSATNAHPAQKLAAPRLGARARPPGPFDPMRGSSAVRPHPVEDRRDYVNGYRLERAPAGLERACTARPPTCAVRQDGASAHAANRAQAFPDAWFPRFSGKSVWRPNAPDLNSQVSSARG